MPYKPVSHTKKVIMVKSHKRHISKPDKERDWGPNYCKECDTFEKNHICPKKDIATGDWQIG